ncbi:MAG: hypothetical protein AAFP17_18320 [Pseudomonadota bacterium]
MILKRLGFVAGLSVLLAGCLGAEKPVESAKAPERPIDRTVSDCYTVVLFDDVEVKKPADDVPFTYAAFLGEWTNGAWDGKWCHDLLIYEVSADGRVEMMDMHAPYEPWNQPASAFRRVGRIDKDGVLRFAHGTTQRSYQIVNGRLEGRRSGGASGEYVAQLKRPWDVPVPRPRPVGIAAATGTGSSG